MSAWVIEVTYYGDASRAPRYFTGECTPGWIGRTTVDIKRAQWYSRIAEAVDDLHKLTPRDLGAWHVAHLAV